VEGILPSYEEGIGRVSGVFVGVGIWTRRLAVWRAGYKNGPKLGLGVSQHHHGNSIDSPLRY
jgi:hypothetical protein